MIVKMWLWLSLYIIFFNSGGVLCTVQPSFTDSSRIGYSESKAISFPDDGRTGNCPHPFQFIGDMNFLTGPGTGSFLIGSADVLFMLNDTTLRCVDHYFWNTSNIVSSMCSGEDFCHNYIRLYQRLPSDHSRLLVCGTQSSFTPQCRTIEFTDLGFNITSATGTYNTSDKLISNFPELHQFGEFVDNTATSATSMVYLSGAFFEDGERRNIFGTDYNITYHQISYDDLTGELDTTANYSLKGGTSWLLYPVTLVDFYRADYVDAGQVREYYFLFVRETLPDVLPEVVNSRVVRICRNDPGADGQFTTFIKTGIFCEIDTPRSREFIGVSDYQYNDITAMVFNDDGRHAENEVWSKYMYGAFSGPRLGPRGSAICIYQADFGINSGIVGTLNKELRQDNGDGDTLSNDFSTCPVGGRSPPDSGYIRTVDDIVQYLPPLVILDGVIVSQMVLDRVCVITKTSSHLCLNQDTLFLGTDTGMVLKVVFSTSTVITTEPVISEEISLGDNSRVDDMTIKDIDGVKFVFVSTITRVHRIPLERCSRLQGCQACIGARDPYCVWNNNTQLCENGRNHLSASGSSSGTVRPEIWQNIHTGSTEQCDVQVNCVVAALAIDHETIMCSVGCNGTDTISISSSLPFPTSANCSSNDSFSSTRGCKLFTSSQALGLHSYVCFAESRFSASVQTLPSPPVPFEDGVFSSCGQTLCTICVHLVDFTDYFTNYAFQVHYSSTSVSMFETTPSKRLSENNCVVIRSLVPGSTLNYQVEIQNNISTLNSTLRSVGLQEGFSGPVEDLDVVVVTNVSLTVSWSLPSEQNGIVSGYSIYVNNISELSCVQGFTGLQYSVNNLIPSTNYSLTVYACTGAGESNMSKQITSQTLCGTPGSVVNVAAEDITYNSMTFDWDRPVNYNDNNNIQYEVITSVYDINGIISSRTNLSQSLHHLLNISPRTLCCAEIYAVSTCSSFRLVGHPFHICDRTLHTTPVAVSNLMTPSGTIGIMSFSLVWEPPLNLNTTPGVTYNIVINNRSSRNLTDTTFLHVNNLNPCTAYTIEVSACFSEQCGPGRVINVITKSLLPPPENVQFYHNESGRLIVVWTPLEFDCDDEVRNYRVNWRCNEIFSDMNNTISSSLTTWVIDFSAESVGIGWCVANVQSCDADLRCGEFSSDATVSLYQSPPSQPRCLLQMQSTSTNIGISFFVSQPFITSRTRVEWNLTRTNLNSVLNGSYPYTLSSVNILDLLVDSNSDYIFNLRICDIYGCGEPCNINFKTSDIPMPPEDIEVINVTNTTASITWRSTSAQLFSYSISISSSCPTGTNLINVNATTHTIDNLCPNSNYTIAIRSTDLAVNKSSVYSEVINFSTLPGIPTRPRYVLGIIDANTKELRITWIVPVELNGIIANYEVRWTFNTLQCDEDKSDIPSQTTSNASTFQFIYNVVNINIESYAVCVRAITTAGTFGAWGININNGKKTSGLITTPGEDCNTLIAVACVAALTIASSLIMSIVLSVSVMQKGWFCFKNGIHEEKIK